MQQQIYFYIIQIKHMQHTSKTHETTYDCNMCSSPCCCLMEAHWRGTRRRRESELDGTEWITATAGGVRERTAQGVRAGGLVPSGWTGALSYHFPWIFRSWGFHYPSIFWWHPFCSQCLGRFVWTVLSRISRTVVICRHQIGKSSSHLFAINFFCLHY
jgi:hypothetical protein